MVVAAAACGVHDRLSRLRARGAAVVDVVGRHGWCGGRMMRWLALDGRDGLEGRVLIGSLRVGGVVRGRIRLVVEVGLGVGGGGGVGRH